MLDSSEEAKTPQEQLKQVQAWLEKDIYQLDQMVQTLQDYYTLTPEDIQHLNRHAKRTLLSMLPALVDSIFIRIARLTEPAKKCGHNNLTLGSLVHLLRDLGETKKADYTHELLKKVQDQSNSIREDHRNKTYAHVDFSVAMGSKPLPPIPVQLLRDVTDSIEILITKATGSGYSFKADSQGNIKKLAICLKEYFEMKTAKR